MATNWRIYNTDTIAVRLDRCDLPGFFSKRVIVGPNEAALVLRDGQPFDLLTEGRVNVAGVLDQLKSVFCAGVDIAVYFLDLAPLDLTIFFGEQTTEARYEQQRTESLGTAELGLKTGGLQPGESEEQESAKLRSVADKVVKKLWEAVPRIGWAEEERTATKSVSETRKDVSRVSILAVSADRDVISGSCHIRLRIDADSVTNLLGLLRGKRGLASWDIAALIRDEFLANVLVPEIARHPSSSLRGNRTLLAQMESDTRSALATTLATFGLMLDSFSIQWGLTELERMQIAGRRAQREEQARDFANKRKIAELMRQQEIKKTDAANLQELKMADAAGKEELVTLHLAAIAKRNLLIKNNRLDQRQVDLQINEANLQIEKADWELRLWQKRSKEELRLDIEDRQFKQDHAARLAKLEASDKEMWSLVKMQVEMATQKHEREMALRKQQIDAEFRKMEADIEDRYEQRKLKLEESKERMGMQERLVAQGLSTGHADASVLNTMLQQATDQEYATTSDEKVKARAAAQAAGQNLETYRTAQADERGHQQRMTGLAAEMMAAAKQTPPSVVMPAGSGQPFVINNAAPSEPPPAAQADKCQSCHYSVKPGIKFCPNCGKPLA
jgi:hypothetical protein